MQKETDALPSVAIIGSFRQHYGAVLEAIELFKEAGWSVCSPAGTKVVEPGIDFVRFETDQPDLSDAEIQAVTLENIFAADLTFVVAPGGYVGRTTCYEIGRLLQARRPVVFSEHPRDLPVGVPEEHVATARLAACSFKNQRPDWPHAIAHGLMSSIERRLTNGS